MWRTVTDLDVPRIVDLLTGELDYACCDAGCRLSTRASIVFRDSEGQRLYVAPGELVGTEAMAAVLAADLPVDVLENVEELRRIVADLIDRRVWVFLPVITGGPDGVGDTNYLCDQWRLFTAPVMAAVGVSLTGRVSRIRFAFLAADDEPTADREDYAEQFFSSRQAGIWTSMLIDWTNGDGVGSFEEDLSEYVDRTTFLGDPLRFTSALDNIPYPAEAEDAMKDMYRREALRASLYARGDQSDHVGR